MTLNWTLISLYSPVCEGRWLRVSPKDASECLLSCVTQLYYLFLNRDPKLRECKFINKHPSSLLHFHSLPQTHYPSPLFPYPECFLLPKRNGWRNAIETHGPCYLTGSNEFSSFCCAVMKRWLIPKLRPLKAGSAYTLVAGPVLYKALPRISLW